jgi:P27 family predicted phage terminase small subunit
MSGPPPIPTALKVLRGNPGKKRIKGEPIPDPSPIDPPAWLEGDALAVAIWRDEAPRLLRLGLLGDVDRLAFAALCERAATYQRAAREIRCDPTQPVGRMRQPKAEVSIARAAAHGLVQLASRFGMTPADRARITAGVQPAGAPSKWAGLVRR